jgi:hypothetical protein
MAKEKTKSPTYTDKFIVTRKRNFSLSCPPFRVGRRHTVLGTKLVRTFCFAEKKKTIDTLLE